MLEISFPHPRNIIPHPCITFFFVLQVIYVFFLNWVKTNEFWSKKYQRMKKTAFRCPIFHSEKYTVYSTPLYLSSQRNYITSTPLHLSSQRNKKTSIPLYFYPLKEIRKLVYPVLILSKKLEN